jgi:hypothetical protein
MTTLVLPGVFSLAAKARPSSGRTRSTLKSDALTSATGRRVGSPSPVRIMRPAETAATLSRVVAIFVTSVKFGPDITARRPSLVWYTPTSRSGCGYGSGRSRTPLTTLKMAVLAPMPSARVIAATAVNPGDFTRRRRANWRSWRK